MLNKKNVLRHSFTRFLISGASTTGVSLIVYWVLLRYFPYQWSYTLGYISGIGVAYLLYRYFVFKKSAGKFGLLWVSLVYLLQYLLGLGLVSIWVKVWLAPEFLAPIFSVIVSVPITFLLNRFIFNKKN